MKIQKKFFVIFAMTFAIFFFSSCSADRIEFPAKYTYYEIGNYHDESAFVYNDGVFEPVIGPDMIEEVFRDIDDPIEVPFLELTLLNESEFSFVLVDEQDQSNESGTYTKEEDNYTFRIENGLDVIEFTANRDGNKFQFPAVQHVEMTEPGRVVLSGICSTLTLTDNEGEEPDEILNPCDRNLNNYYENPQEGKLYFARYFDFFFQKN